MAAQADVDQDRGMHFELELDLAITGSAGVTWLALELLMPSLVTECRWCDRHADGSDSLNGFDRHARDALRWNNAHSADTWSTVFSFVLAPVSGIGVAALITQHDDRLDELLPDMLIVAESAFLALSFNQLVKAAAARERPDVHARSPEARTERYSYNDNLSFFSGHTNIAFALATSAGTIASMRGYRLAPVMWAVGLSCATVSGYLRIAADRHYATDVITGAAIGAAFGFGVPYLLHQPRASQLRVSAAPSAHGSSVMLSGSF